MYVKNKVEGIIMNYIPTIIGVAEATHYLVGSSDEEENFIPLKELGSVVVCQSLCAAKTLLRENNIHSAKLTLQTAYDEMCGLPSSSATNQIINL
jgi:hypothetical protein